MGEKEWLYKTAFAFDVDGNRQSSVDMVFEGLDTFCDIYLVKRSLSK